MHSVELCAQFKGSGTLAGRVVDAESGESVGFTYLLIEELHFWQRVNSDGTFRFDNIPSGTHSVKSYRLGYQESVHRVVIREGRSSEITVRISASPVLLDDVIISAHRMHGDSLVGNPDLVVADRKLYFTCPECGFRCIIKPLTGHLMIVRQFQNLKAIHTGSDAAAGAGRKYGVIGNINFGFIKIALTL